MKGAFMLYTWRDAGRPRLGLGAAFNALWLRDLSMVAVCSVNAVPDRVVLLLATAPLDENG